jgi:N-acetylneuraminate synthase
MNINNILKRAKRFIKYRGHYPTPNPIQIGHYVLGRGYPRFIIAEIGINHNGSVDIAKKLIDTAVNAGAQAVKFQKRTVNKVYSPEELAKPRAVDRNVLEIAVERGVLADSAVQRLKKSDFKDSTNGDLKWALEFTEDEYRELFEYANQNGLVAFASPWDNDSVDAMERVGVWCHKIASASLTDIGLLEKVRATGKPVIASTGMSTPEEIEKAVHILGKENLILMHTVSTYPSQDYHLNIKAIASLKELYPEVIVGYSGHEKGIAPTLGAAMLGALTIERHITLDKTMYGSDQSASLEPNEFTDLVQGIREIEIAYGDGVKRVIEEEIPVRAKLRRA